MASAMTPEPTVAIVRVRRGDIAPEYSARVAVVPGRRWQRQAAAPSEQEEPAGRRDLRRGEARLERASSSSGA